MNEKDLGKRLQLARKRAGLTQQDLCHKAGLSYSTLAKIERGAIKSPSVFTVAAIAGATQTPLEELLQIEKIGSPEPDTEAKKRSKSGVRFVYFDVNGTIVRFYHRAFTEIARQTGKSPDIVETIHWRYNDAAISGKLSFDEFNSTMARELGIAGFDWRRYYMENVEPMPGIKELIEWTAQYYEVGIFSNNMPGFIDELQERGVIPKIKYAAVVDSSKVGLIKPDPKIYDQAQQLAAMDPQEILLVDDTRANLIAADKAGWQVLWFDEMQPKEGIEKVRKALEF